MAKLLFELLESNQQFQDTVTKKSKIYAANEVILQENVAHNTVYLIKQGEVRVVQTATTEDNRDIHPAIQTLSAGQYFGEFCLYGNLPATADIVTNTECELIEIEKESCVTFFEKNPDLGYKFTKLMIEEMIEKICTANKAMRGFLVWGMKQHGIDKDL